MISANYLLQRTANISIMYQVGFFCQAFVVWIRGARLLERCHISRSIYGISSSPRGARNIEKCDISRSICGISNTPSLNPKIFSKNCNMGWDCNLVSVPCMASINLSFNSLIQFLADKRPVLGLTLEGWGRRCRSQKIKPVGYVNTQWQYIEMFQNITILVKQHLTFSEYFFKASALWANAFYKSKCPSVCVSVCVCVHFWGTV